MEEGYWIERSIVLRSVLRFLVVTVLLLDWSIPAAAYGIKFPKNHPLKNGDLIWAKPRGKYIPWSLPPKVMSMGKATDSRRTSVLELMQSQIPDDVQSKLGKTFFLYAEQTEFDRRQTC